MLNGRLSAALRAFFRPPILEETWEYPHPECLMLRLTCIYACLVGTLFLCQEGLVSAGAWPQWRGPNRDGVSNETGLLDHWTNDGPPLKWKTKGLGGGFSSVAIVDGRIYTMGVVGNTDSKYGASAPAPKRAAGKRGQATKGRGRSGGNAGDCMLMALDVNNGKPIWATKVGTGDPNCTPTVDGDRVYCLDRNGALSCVDATDGKVIWSKSLVTDFGGHMMSGWGYSESPLIDGEKLVCTPGGSEATLIALDKKTGQTIWKAKAPADLGPSGADGAGYSSIVVSNGGGVKQFVQLVGRGLVSFRAEDGKFLWHYNRVANHVANIPTPLVKDDFVFASSGYGAGAALLKLKADGDGVSAQEIYFLPGNKVQNHHGGMVLFGDHVYLGNGHNNGFPLFIELKTGKVAWNGGRGPGTGSAAVLEADGDLYFRYQNGTMALIQASPDKYELKGSFKLATHNGESWPHPVIVDHCLYLRDQDALLCYDISSSRSSSN